MGGEERGVQEGAVYCMQYKFDALDPLQFQIAVSVHSHTRT